MKETVRLLIEECDNELLDIEQRMSGINAFDSLRRYLTNYALIKASGAVEVAYRSIVADYFDASNLPQIPHYIDAMVRRSSSSGKYDNMKKLLKSFDDEWARKFKEQVLLEEHRDRVIQSSNSLVDNRHLFAHGMQPTASFSDIMRYYEDAKVLIEMIDRVINHSLP